MTTNSTIDFPSSWVMPGGERAVSDAPVTLSEADWTVIAAALTRIRSNVGRPFRDERRTIEAVIWRARSKARWREIPETLGPWWRAAQLYYRWAKSGLWLRLQADLCKVGREDLAELFANESENVEEAP